MEKDLSNTINNVLTVLGGALLLYPIIDQAAKVLAPEFEKLKSGEYEKQLQLLTDGKEKSEGKPKEHAQTSEIDELRKKLEEFERKEKEKKGE